MHINFQKVHEADDLLIRFYKLFILACILRIKLYMLLIILIQSGMVILSRLSILLNVEEARSRSGRPCMYVSLTQSLSSSPGSTSWLASHCASMLIISKKYHTMFFQVRVGQSYSFQLAHATPIFRPPAFCSGHD